MENFTYYTPTKVVFGKGTENQTGALVKEQHCKKVLIHYGSGSVVRSGLLDRIKTSLDEAAVSYVELGGVVPNPRLSLVYEGIELCKKENVDFILAVGGGSVIDSAKAIGYGVYNGGDVWDFYDFKRQAEGCLPIGAVLTIAAAGSEMSGSSVITKEDGQIKRGYSSNFSRARFAVMNPELTMTLPPYQTASGCVDILMHTMERYFNQCDNMELTDGISESLMRTVMKNAKILKDEPAVLNQEIRMETIANCISADYVVLADYDPLRSVPFNFANTPSFEWLNIFTPVVEALKPDIFVHEDNVTIREARKQLFKKYNVESVLNPRTEGISTTDIIDKIKTRLLLKMQQ